MIRRGMVVLFLLPILAGAVLLFPGPSLAQEKSVIVEQRQAQITILPSGDVEVRETWVVNFSGGPFTRAYRSIPFNKVTSIDAWTVSEEGQPYQRSDSGSAGSYSLVVEGGSLTARWYFPPTTDQTRTFQLGYTLHGALRIDPAGDQFYWIFVEAGREYTIQQAVVSLRLPAEAAPEQIKVAAYQGSQEVPGASIQDGQTVLFQGGPFGPSQAWEIRVQFPHGLVSASPPDWQRGEITPARVRWINFLGVALAILALGGGGYLLKRTYKRDKIKIKGKVSAPPASLPPALAGALVKGYVHDMHLAATLVHLAQRGHLRIHDAGASLELTRLRTAQPDLLPYEHQLLETLFARQETLNRADWNERFKAASKGFRRGVNRQLALQGYQTLVHPAVILLPSAMLFFIVLPLLALTLSGGEALWAMLACFLTGMMLFLFAFMATGTTLEGQQAAKRWEKFRQHLDYPAREPDAASFEAWLPYAVAFNQERSWVGAFEGRDLPVPEWILRGAGFAALYKLVDSLETELRGLLRAPALRSRGWQAGDSGGWSWGSSDSGGGGGVGGGGDGGGGGSSGFG